MTIWIVSRHLGAVEWLKEQGILADHVVPHLLTEAVQSRDTVYGVLPLKAIAEITAKGADFYALDMDLPFQNRGCELTAAELNALGCRLQKYRVYKEE